MSSTQIIHIFDGEMVEDLIEDVVERFQINKVVIIGSIQKNIPFPSVIFVTISKKDKETIPNLIYYILTHLSKLNRLIDYTYYVNLNSSDPSRIIFLQYLSNILGATSYKLIDDSIFTYPIISLNYHALGIINNGQLKLLKMLTSMGGLVGSLGEIAHELGWGEKDSPKAVNRVSYISGKMEKLKLVNRNSQAKRVELKLTSLGYLVALSDVFHGSEENISSFPLYQG